MTEGPFAGPRVEVDLDALVANWRMLARRAAGAAPAAVVKADAYGLGAIPAAKALAAAGCRRFYVAWAHEGALLRAALGPAPEIAVFHGPQASDLHIFKAANLSPVLNSLQQIAFWLETAGGPAALHADTGMNRLGVPEPEWSEAARLLANAPPTHLISHLACGDEPDHPMNARQLAAVHRASALFPDARRSLSATAGVYLGADYALDEIRPGIGMYGGGPIPRTGERPSPVARIRAPIVQIRTIPAGQTTGYGASWTADIDRTVATVGMGYADGFLRSASNRGYGVILGERRPILGRVSMDTIMLDVTGLPATVGDDVELAGEAMPIGEQADAMATIDYEFLTRLGHRGPRVYRGGA
jgi:alanine racemase